MCVLLPCLFPFAPSLVLSCLLLVSSDFTVVFSFPCLRLRGTGAFRFSFLCLSGVAIGGRATSAWAGCALGPRHFCRASFYSTCTIVCRRRAALSMRCAGPRTDLCTPRVSLSVVSTRQNPRASTPPQLPAPRRLCAFLPSPLCLLPVPVSRRALAPPLYEGWSPREAGRRGARVRRGGTRCGRGAEDGGRGDVRGERECGREG
ncbi:hypothetical protein B0H17DRAFT_1096032 [Mycena rosella]|uniref:Uncharacterized protein n=1 Tax=Mycena rosella TaxID=1033263 RepID=A0AAD7CRD9_MYCRO|nr:hypothetical protein B0H17DRAFT_1096032 [Mycena rosella]